MLKRLKHAGHRYHLHITLSWKRCAKSATGLPCLRDGASVGSGITSEVKDADIIRLMVGRDVSELYPRTASHAR